MLRTDCSPAMKALLDPYADVQKIGEGTDGDVYRATDRGSGKQVALKKYRLENEQGVPVNTMREISLLKELKQANMVQ